MRFSALLGARRLVSWEGSALRVLIIISAVALSGLFWASFAAARHIRKMRRQRGADRLRKETTASALGAESRERETASLTRKA